MNNDIKPIDTIYKGYRFRSRLEARWAVFLDACGADWEYEAEGFDLGDGVFYLPDFVVHNDDWHSRFMWNNIDGDLYIEVKGIVTEKDKEKFTRFAFAGKKLLVVGKIPFAGRPTEGNLFDAFITGNDRSMEDVCFCDAYLQGKAWDNYPVVIGYRRDWQKIDIFDDNEWYDFADVPKTNMALLKARQARFEHGENG